MFFIQAIVPTGALILFLIISSITALTIFRVLRKKQHDVTGNLSDQTFIDLEKYSPPLIAQFIDGKGASTRHITAGLLALVRKRVLSLQLDEKMNEYYFKDLSNNDVILSRDEAYLLKWFLYEVGNNGTFYTKDLENFTTDDDKRERFIQRLYEWENLMSEALKEAGFEVAFPKTKKLLVGTSSLMLVVGSTLLFFYPFISLLYLLGAVSGMVATFVLPNVSEKGWDVYHRWRNCKEQISKQRIEDTTEREKMTASFILALAFGLKDQFVEKFPIRESSQIAVRQEHFPLYFIIAPGSAAISAEGIEAIDETESAMEKVLSPVGHNFTSDELNSESE
ncbi:DUF2207 domain-containing protein [Bacillus shivajii]|uniref:DUF2207 family protein n=1 Tax=Bacillus shivajii TaxID=1983719 RepID=UPI001CFB45CE|nr:DUF2207 domain-containing protein [Bacillus shivajii]UCZ51577.1 DUF2207 domain-containing protein [Bacillus shivajii]